MTVELVIAAVILGAQLGLRLPFSNKGQATSNKENKIRTVFKTLFFLAVVIVFAVQAYWAREQFLAWHNAAPPLNYLVPPYRGIGYFLSYGYTHFFMKYLLSFAASLALLFSSKFLNRKFQYRFFEEEEPYIAASALFLSGHPGWLLTIIFVLALSVLLSTFYFLFSSKKERVPLYYLWLPASIFAILLL
ncbi:MAG: hypothetical protein HY456_02995 [Parcubacteria group bacterium]|nr:hypothetical protein [Parcubacteria group bacterium]